MKIIFYTIALSFICSLSSAESYLERPQEVRARQSNSCSLEDFSSKEKAEQYIAQHGGELYRDQDTHVYRAVKCKYTIDDRVVVVVQPNL